MADYLKDNTGELKAIRAAALASLTTGIVAIPQRPPKAAEKPKTNPKADKRRRKRKAQRQARKTRRQNDG